MVWVESVIVLYRHEYNNLMNVLKHTKQKLNRRKKGEQAPLNFLLVNYYGIADLTRLSRCVVNQNKNQIEVIRKGRVRRAKLYYIRGLSKKASRIKESNK